MTETITEKLKEKQNLKLYGISGDDIRNTKINSPGIEIKTDKNYENLKIRYENIVFSKNTTIVQALMTIHSLKNNPNSYLFDILLGGNNNFLYCTCANSKKEKHFKKNLLIESNSQKIKFEVIAEDLNNIEHFLDQNRNFNKGIKLVSFLHHINYFWGSIIDVCMFFYRN